MVPKTPVAATKVIVPSHIPDPLPDHLRSELISALLSTSAIDPIQSVFHMKCKETGWLDTARQRAMEIIRNREASSWSEVMKIMIKEACEKGGRDEGNGIGTTQDQQKPSGPTPSKLKANIEIPDSVADAGVRAVRKALDNFIQIDGGPAS